MKKTTVRRWPTLPTSQARLRLQAWTAWTNRHRRLHVNHQQPTVFLNDFCIMPPRHEADWRCDASKVFPKTTFTAFHIHCVVCFYGLSMFIGCCFTLLGHCSSNVFMCFWHICSTLMFKADVVYARATSVSVVILRLLLKWLLCDAFTSMTLWFCYFLKRRPVSRPKRALVDC